MDRAHATTTANLSVLFLREEPERRQKLIAGPTVYICDECIGLCNDIIAEEIEKESESFGLAPVPKPAEDERPRRLRYLAAYHHLRQDDGHLFVTGRAGTGKSTLLRCLKDMLAEEMVVLAPTGLAAVNVGGQTIHSFFGLPPRLVRPDDIRRSRNGRLMRRLKFLVIDEVSMVRSDLMWAIDQSLRVNRGRPREPFGGVRLALFGDLHQLPPVVNDGEVAEHLESASAVRSSSAAAAARAAGTSLIELAHVFRQKDEALLAVLNSVREGDADEDDLVLLNSRVHPIRTLSDGEPYVILTPTNAAAGRINMAYLNALPGDRGPMRPARPASSARRRSRPRQR